MRQIESLAELPRAFDPLLGVKARFKGFYSGRGAAKSQSFATALVIEASNFRPTKDDPDHRVLCCREIMRTMAESTKRDIDAAIVRLGLTYMFQSTKHEVAGSNGSWFGFEGLRGNANNIRSYRRIKRAWIEEANTVSQASLDTLEPTIRDPGSEIWASWNPREPTDPIDVLFRGPNAGQSPDPELMREYDVWMIARRVSVDDNFWFPDVLRASMNWDAKRNPDRYAHVWLGEYRQISEARVFRNWKPEAIEVPKGMRPLYGADWGFSVSPTVLVKCYLFKDKRLLYVERCISRIGVPIDKTPEFFDTLDDGEVRRWPMRADSARPETINYMNTHGYPLIVGARKGPGSIEEGVEFLKNWDILIHPNCRPVIDEFTLYSYETDKLTGKVLPILVDKNNNTVDAVRYAVEDERRQPGLIIPEILTETRSYFGDNIGDV